MSKLFITFALVAVMVLSSGCTRLKALGVAAVVGDSDCADEVIYGASEKEKDDGSLCLNPGEKD